MIIESEQLAELTRDVCQAMLGLELAPCPQHQLSCEHLTSSVCIRGDWNRVVEVVASPDAARCLAATMFAIEPDDVQAEEVNDAVAEVANMIGGNIKGILGGDCDLSIPEVAAGSASESETLATATFDLNSGVIKVVYRNQS